MVVIRKNVVVMSMLLIVVPALAKRKTGYKQVKQVTMSTTEIASEVSAATEKNLNDTSETATSNLLETSTNTTRKQLQCCLSILDFGSISSCDAADYGSIHASEIRKLLPIDDAFGAQEPDKGNCEKITNKESLIDINTPTMPVTVKNKCFNTHKYTVRHMTMKDIAPVHRLGESVFTMSELRDTYPFWDDFAVVACFFGSPGFSFVVENKDTITTALSSARDLCTVGDHKQEIIGFLLGDPKKPGYIQFVAVAPDYRRLGVASALMTKYSESAQMENISFLVAESHIDNIPAIRLFEKSGLRYKSGHMYLKKLLEDVETEHINEDGNFDFHYLANGQNIRIRNMAIEDLHSIYRIGEDIFTGNSSNLFRFWDEAMVLHSYLNDPEYAITASIKDDEGEEKVIGFAFGTVIGNKRTTWRYGYIEWLGCHPEYQRLGLGTQIYKIMAEILALQGLHMILIDTQPSNVAALRFFRKLGFGYDEEYIFLSNKPVTLII